VLAALIGVAAAALPIPSPPDHRINDFAGIPPPGERDRLEDKLRARERESSQSDRGRHLPMLEGENSRTTRSVRAGLAHRPEGSDNGVSSWFRHDRKMRLEVGYGSSQADRRAIGQIPPPGRRAALREGRRRRIAAGLEAIDQVIAGTYKAAPEGEARGAGTRPFALALLAIVIIGISWIVISGLHESHARARAGQVARAAGAAYHLSRGGGGGVEAASGGTFSGAAADLAAADERRLVMSRHPQWVTEFCPRRTRIHRPRVAQAEPGPQPEVRVHLDHVCKDEPAAAGHQVFRALGMPPHRRAQRRPHLHLGDGSQARMIGDRASTSGGRAYWPRAGRCGQKSA